MSDPSLYKYFGAKPDTPYYIEVLFSAYELEEMDLAVQKQIELLLQDIDFINVPSTADFESWENLENLPITCRLGTLAEDPVKVLDSCTTYKMDRFISALKLLAFTFRITKAKYDEIAALLANPTADIKARLQTDTNSSSIILPPYPSLNCSNSDDAYFCNNSDTYIQTCSPFTEQDATTYVRPLQQCAYRLLSTKDVYDKAVALLKQKGITGFPPYPALDCATFSDATFCQTPMPFLESCSVLEGKPLSTYVSKVVNCALTKQMPEAEYNRVATFLSNKGFSLKSYPNVDCTDNTQLCSDPLSYVIGCGQLSGKNPSVYKEKIIDCLRNKTISELDYEALRYYMFKNQVILPPYPKTDCKIENICIDPANYIQTCGTLENLPTKAYVDPVKSCVYNSQIAKPTYDAAKNVIELANIKMPDYPPVNCQASSTGPGFCSNIKSHIQSCGPFSNKDSMFYLNQIRSCLDEGSITQNDYNDISEWLKTFGVNLGPYSNLNCNNLSDLDAVCPNLLDVATSCPTTNYTPFVDLLRSCSDNGKINQKTYDSVRKFLLQQGVEVPSFFVSSAFDCKDLAMAMFDKSISGTDLDKQQAYMKKVCKTPMDYVNKCPKAKPEQLRNVLAQCSANKLTNEEEWYKLQSYMKQTYDIDMPDYSIPNCNSDFASYCQDIIGYSKYCKADQTDESIVKDVNTCIANNLMPWSQYQRTRDYFAAKNIPIAAYANTQGWNCSNSIQMCANFGPCALQKEAENNGFMSTGAETVFALGCTNKFTAEANNYGVWHKNLKEAAKFGFANQGKYASFDKAVTDFCATENQYFNLYPKEYIQICGKTSNEVFHVIGTGTLNDKGYTQKDALKVCKTLGGTLANKAQLTDAYNKGARWCYDGHLSDGVGSPCDTGLSIQSTPNPNAKLGINCIGVKPEKSTSSAHGVLPFNGISWNSPASVDVPKYLKKVQQAATSFSITPEQYDEVKFLVGSANSYPGVNCSRFDSEYCSNPAAYFTQCPPQYTDYLVNKTSECANIQGTVANSYNKAIDKTKSKMWVLYKKNYYPFNLTWSTNAAKVSFEQAKALAEQQGATILCYNPTSINFLYGNPTQSGVDINLNGAISSGWSTYTYLAEKPILFQDYTSATQRNLNTQKADICASLLQAYGNVVTNMPESIRTNVWNALSCSTTDKTPSNTTQVCSSLTTQYNVSSTPLYDLPTGKDKAKTSGAKIRNFVNPRTIIIWFSLNPDFDREGVLMGNAPASDTRLPNTVCNLSVTSQKTIIVKIANNTVCASTSTLTSSTVYQLVVTITPNNINMYLNGSFDASSENTTVYKTFNVWNSVLLGKDNSTTSPLFKGKITSVQVLPTAYSSAEVGMLYNWSNVTFKSAYNALNCDKETNKIKFSSCYNPPSTIGLVKTITITNNVPNSALYAAIDVTDDTNTVTTYTPTQSVTFKPSVLATDNLLYKSSSSFATAVANGVWNAQNAMFDMYVLDQNTFIGLQNNQVVVGTVGSVVGQVLPQVTYQRWEGDYPNPVNVLGVSRAGNVYFVLGNATGNPQDNKIWYFNGTNWIEVYSSYDVKSFGIGKDGTIVMIDNAGALYVKDSYTDIFDGFYSVDLPSSAKATTLSCDRWNNNCAYINANREMFITADVSNPSWIRVLGSYDSISILGGAGLAYDISTSTLRAKADLFEQVDNWFYVPLPFNARVPKGITPLVTVRTLTLTSSKAGVPITLTDVKVKDVDGNNVAYTATASDNSSTLALSDDNITTVFRTKATSSTPDVLTLDLGSDKQISSIQIVNSFDTPNNIVNAVWRGSNSSGNQLYKKTIFSAKPTYVIDMKSDDSFTKNANKVIDGYNLYNADRTLMCYTDYPAPSQAECENLCLNNPDCNAYNYYNTDWWKGGNGRNWYFGACCLKSTGTQGIMRDETDVDTYVRNKTVDPVVRVDQCINFKDSSTAISDACLNQMWNDLGCSSNLPAGSLSSWKTTKTMATVRSEMLTAALGCKTPTRTLQQVLTDQQPCSKLTDSSVTQDLTCLRSFWKSVGCPSNAINEGYKGSWANTSKQSALADMKTYLPQSNNNNINTRNKADLCYGAGIGVNSISMSSSGISVILSQNPPNSQTNTYISPLSNAFSMGMMYYGLSVILPAVKAVSKVEIRSPRFYRRLMNSDVSMLNNYGETITKVKLLAQASNIITAKAGQEFTTDFGQIASSNECWGLAQSKSQNTFAIQGTNCYGTANNNFTLNLTSNEMVEEDCLRSGNIAVYTKV